MAEEKRLEKLFWLDMEMTGLDEKKCSIIEASAVITDLNLKPLDEYTAVVFQPPEVLASMDEWCTNTHGKSGLTAEVARGEKLSTIEKKLVALGTKHFGKEKVILCGNTIGQDRKFVDLYMPSFAKLLHYRMIDVSSFKEVFRNKYNIEFKKKETHRAKDDIFESIAELAHYLTFIKL